MDGKLKNIIIISLDCVRQESISIYRNSNFPFIKRVPLKAKTPSIDSIGKKGLVFNNAITQAPYTPASHASLFTGCNPYIHGIRAIFGYKLKDTVPTMAEILKKQDYLTAAVIGADAVGRSYDLHRGFDLFDDDYQKKEKNWYIGYKRSAPETSQRAITFLKNNKHFPFCLFIHFFSTHSHGKYTEHERHQIWEANKVDKHIGEIINTLKTIGVFDDTIFIILSDHGDSFGEHGEPLHKLYLYDTTLKVVLIMKFPGLENAEVITDQVRLIDILPTVLAYLHIESPPVQGVNLLDRQSRANLTAYSETRHEISYEKPFDYVTKLACLRTLEWKYIYDFLDNSAEFYNLIEDPAETRNLITTADETAEAFRSKLMKMLGDAPEEDVPEGKQDDDLKNKLRNLGYLD